MGKIAFSNTGKDIAHVGTKTIWPGGTREVEESMLNPAQRKMAGLSETQETPVDTPLSAPELLLSILDGSVAEVTTAIQARNTEGKPDIHNEGLAALKEAEENGKTRTTLIKAIDEEMLIRADEATGGNPNSVAELEELTKSAREMTDEDLLGMADLIKDDEEKLSIVNQVIEERKKAAAELETYTASVREMSDEDLLAQMDLVQDNPEKLSIVNQVFDEREEPSQ